MGSQDARDTAGELGRRAARLLRRSRPAIQQAVAEARPRVEQAAKDAWRYAQQHEDEIKRAALKGARLRVRGPFGFVVDALNNSLQGRQRHAAEPACPGCGASNPPSARFCSQCGVRLTDS